MTRDYRKDLRQRSKKVAENEEDTAKMGGLSKERSEKDRGGRKVERKGQQHGPMYFFYKSSRRPPSPLHKGKQRNNKLTRDGS